MVTKPRATVTKRGLDPKSQPSAERLCGPRTHHQLRDASSQRHLLTVSQNRNVFSIARSPKLKQPCGIHHRASTQPDELVLWQLRFKPAKCRTNKALRLADVKDDVVLGRLDPVDFGECQPGDLGAVFHKDAPRLPVASRTVGGLSSARIQEAACLDQCLPKSLLGERLEEVIDSVDAESTHRMFGGGFPIRV